MKRRTIELDEALRARARRVLGGSTTRATVEEALRRLIDSAEAAQDEARAPAPLFRGTRRPRGPPGAGVGRHVAVTMAKTPAGWVLDKSVAVHASHLRVTPELAGLAGRLFVCPIGELEQLYSARSAADYDALTTDLRASFGMVAAPADIVDRALQFRADLAHHHGMWHRTPIPDLLIAETTLHH